MGSKGEKPNETYERLCDILPSTVATYCLCAVYDVPFYAASADADSWDEYLVSLDRLHPEDGFANGETSYDSAVISGMDRQERWETVWGDGYSENDYKRLDELYLTMTAQLEQSGGRIDRQQEDTARTCARMALQRDKLIRSQNKDDVSTAKTFDEMVRKNLADANMRKADILPSAQQRPDGVVDALKKKYGLSMDMTKDDFLEAFFEWCQERKHLQTLDAEEHALLAILRTMQKNNDMPEPTELPEEMRLGEFGSEFAEFPNDTENEVYDYLHLVRGRFAPRTDGTDDSEE